MVVEHAALCGQRAIRYAALAIREHYLAYRIVSDERWQDIYALYRLAVESDMASRIVKDSLNRQTELSSCHAAFLQALLLSATNPSAMPVRQIAWTDRLLDRWSNQTSLAQELPTELDRGVLAIDLTAPASMHRHQPPPRGPQWRYLDIEPIGRSIKKRVKYLRAGESPAQLGLGEEYAAANAESYLIGLYQEWCDLPVERAMPRRVTDADVPPAQLGLSLAGAHMAVFGEAFVQPEEASQHLRGRQVDEFSLFGGQGQYHAAAQGKASAAATVVAVALESWRIDNESALGFKLTRADGGGRIIHNLLVGIRARPDQPVVAGTVRWLIEGESGQIMMGVRVLPGIPRAIGVRATGINAFSNRFTQALWLPGMAALQSLPTLLIPNSWFKPGRLVEVYRDGQIFKIKLVQLIERGQDFERVSFQGELF